MNFVMMLIALMLVGVCFLLSIKFPYEFLILWGMLASGYDANGIVKYMDTHFGSFSLLMNSVMIIALAFSIWRYNKQARKNFNTFLISGGMLTVWIILCFVFVSSSSGMGIYNIVYTICDYSPIVMMIWMFNHDYYIRKGKQPVNYILFFVCTQVVIAFLIVYLPEIGIHILDKFSGANYIVDGYAYNNNIFHIQDIFSALKSKYLFNGLGQFHNGNDMGFYGVAGVVCAIILMLKNEMKYKILSIFLFVASVLLWGNSGMRGPVIGVAIGLIIYLLFFRKRSEILLIFGVGFIFILFLASELGNELISYFIPKAGNISYTSRAILRLNGFRYISQNPIFGAGGMLGFLTIKQIDPHELPLRMACLFGIPGALFTCYLLYVLPVLEFLKTKNKELIAIVAYSIVVMVSITNNYTDICLFWLLYAEAMCIFIDRSDLDLWKDKKRRIRIHFRK